MATSQTHIDREPAIQQTSGSAPVWSRRIYVGLATLYVLGVTLQVFLAGASMFASGSWLFWHRVLGHLLVHPIPFIPLLLVIFSFVGRLPHSLKWLSGLLVVLAVIQPLVLYLRGGVPMLGAFHVVNALFLFALPLYLVIRARRIQNEVIETQQNRLSAER